LGVFCDAAGRLDQLAMAPLRLDGTPYVDGGNAEWLAFEVARALAEGIAT
jgi:hypothetical protein